MVIPQKRDQALHHHMCVHAQNIENLGLSKNKPKQTK